MSPFPCADSSAVTLGHIVIGRIPEDVIAEVRDRTDIVQVVGQYVQLKRSGSNFKGLCPFHQEKTPSFNVNGERQFFHCFGCQESGDVFTFLMRVEGRQFAEVVEDLAARAGIEVCRTATPGQARAAARHRSERQRGLELNEKVAQLYQKLYQAESGAAARAYVERRGIGEELALAFRLGWASPSGDVVRQLVKREGVSEDFAEKLGLLGRRRSGSGYYDRFWNRLIFPLMNARDEVLGFGGRSLAADDPKAPKYVNTSETMLYHKGEALYGLHAAAASMRRNDLAILVEGNFDVLQLHRWGFDNAVAPMGTALTEQQVRLVKRFCKRATAVFDGDHAGRAAARRAVAVMVAEGIEGKIATLPMGEDPDSLLLGHGAEALSRILDQAQPAIDFLIAELRAEMEDSLPGRARVLEAVAPVIARLESRVVRDLYGDRLSMALDIDRAIVGRAISGEQGAARRLRATVSTAASDDQTDRIPVVKLDPVELEPLGVLFEHPHLFPRAEQLFPLLTNDALRATYCAAAQMQRSSGQVDVARLLQVTSPSIRDAVASMVLSRRYASDGDPTRALDDCLLALRRQRVDGEMTQVRHQIQDAQSQGDTVALDRLKRKLVELIEERRQIHETR